MAMVPAPSRSGRRRLGNGRNRGSRRIGRPPGFDGIFNARCRDGFGGNFFTQRKKDLGCRRKSFIPHRILVGGTGIEPVTPAV